MPRVPCTLHVIPHPTIALLQSNSLPSVVQQEIERMILAGELAPGAKLNEACAGRTLGVSRGPVREAFRMLEEAGLVRQEKNRGVFVREHSARRSRRDLRPARRDGRSWSAAASPSASRRRS